MAEKPAEVRMDVDRLAEENMEVERPAKNESIKIQEQLLEFSHKIGRDWKKFGLSLGFTWARLFQFHASKDLNEAIFDMLCEWQRRFTGTKAEVMTTLIKIHASLATKRTFKWETANPATDTFLYQIAEEVGAAKWKELALKLKIPQSMVDNYERDNKLNVGDAIMDMLVGWRNSFPEPSESLPKLRLALDNIKLGDVAAKVSRNIRANPRLLIKTDKLQWRTNENGSRVPLGDCKGNFYKASYNQEHVVVKIVHEGSILPEADTKQLSREMQCMQQFHHKHTLDMLYLLVDDVNCRYGIVMYFMPNSSLSKLLSVDPIVAWSIKMQILMDICSGMTYLHDQFLMHTNLKPSNILLDNDFRGKVSGFEQARFIDGSRTTTSESSARNRKSMYSSPEILNEFPQTDGSLRKPEERVKPDLASDVWSFGMISFDVAAELQRGKIQERNKRLPFDESVTLQTLSYHYLNNVPIEMPIPDDKIKEKIGEDCPHELIKLIKECCQTEMKHRCNFVYLLSKVSNIFNSCYRSHVEADITDRRKKRRESDW